MGGCNVLNRNDIMRCTLFEALDDLNLLYRHSVRSLALITNVLDECYHLMELICINI